MRGFGLLSALLLVLLWTGTIPVEAAQANCGDTYTIVRGDTLTQIAERCGTTVSALVEVNPEVTDPDHIFAGQELRIPGADTEPPFDTPNTYTVQPGDTLFSLASRFGTTVDAFLARNPTITDPDVIYVGQQLVVPDSTVEQPSITISPTSGSAGTTVNVTASGFPANAPITLGVGRQNSEFDIVDRVQSEADGVVTADVEIPSFAEAGEEWVVVAQTSDRPPQRAVSNVFRVTESSAGAPIFESVEIYLVNMGAGQVGCGDQLVAVERQIAPTPAPLTAALQELLSLNERRLGQSGLYNSLYQSDLEVESIDLSGGTATIRLVGDFLIGGTCDAPRVEGQIRETATQFSTVDDVEIFVNGRPLSELLSAR